jgi:hypothetical protein
MTSEFGWVEIDGERYEHDVIIHTNGEVTKRKKKLSKPFKADYGHTPLSEKELELLKDERPEVVIIGTGQDGALPLTPKAQKILADYDAIILPTPEALKHMTEEKRKAVVILHVTC